MSNKSASRKIARRSVSPLLSSLLRAGDTDSTNPISLKSWIALDALHRGRATDSLLTLLCQQLLISEELCKAGYLEARLTCIREAYAALVRLNKSANSNSELRAVGADYEALCHALVIYDAQLLGASCNHVREAQLVMASRLLDYLIRKKQ